MRKGKFLAIFIAIVLLVAGSICVGVAFKNHSFSGNYEDLTYTPEEAYTNIKIDSDTADVYFALAEDGKTTVVTHLYENSNGSVEVVEGTLVVKAHENRVWYKSMFVFGQKNKVTIYLPSTTYNELNVKNSTGDLNVPAGFTFENVTVKNSTGDIKLRSNVNGLVDLKVSTGDILLDNISVKNLKVWASTGDVKLNKVNVVEDIIQIKTSTGDVNYTDVTCVNLNQNSSTGHAKVVRTVASGKMTITVDTGYIKFENSDAAELKLETDTGDIRGNFLTPKIIYADTDTGKRKYPKSDVGGICEISTDTGDIVITFGEN